MRNGFNADAPARKPRTQIARVLTELASEPEPEQIDFEVADDEAEVGLAEVVAEDDEELKEVPVASRRKAARAKEQKRTTPTGEARPRSASLEASEPAAEREEPISEPPAPVARTPRPQAGRERIAALRERLAAAAQAPAAAAEPKHTAAAVREVVEKLRARLDAADQERLQLTDTLEETRAALARAEAELERERKARGLAEARAEERQQIADDAVAEAEALAAERDQVLADLADQRSVDDEQAELLKEVEAALAQRDAERAAAAKELADLRGLLDARTAEVADLNGRLKSEAADRARLEARIRGMEAEIERLTEATEALESIQALVTKRDQR